MNSILRMCATISTRWAWLVLCVALLLTVAAGYASTRLTVDTSVENILSNELPFRQVEIDYESLFPPADEAVAVVDAPTPGEAEVAARELAADIADRPQQFEHVEVAGSSPYFDRYGLLFLEPDEIAEVGRQVRQARRLLVGLASDPSLRGVASLLGMARSGVEESAAPPETAILLRRLAETISDRAEGKPAEMQWIEMFGGGADPRGTRRIVQMKPVLDDTTISRAVPALKAFEEARKAVTAKHPNVTVRVTGEPVIRQQELSDAFSGAVYASSLSFVLVALSLIIVIRSGRLIVALLVTLVVGSIWTTGLAAIAVGRLNLISVAFLVLFFGLGVDFGTHLGLRHLEEVRQGKAFKEALSNAMAGEGPSITLSAICAALAFLAFVPTSYTGLAEFGIVSALGMLVALIATFTIQPALMALMPPRPRPGRGITVGLEEWTERHCRAILVLGAIATLFAAYIARGIEIDTNPLNLQNQNAEAVQTYRDLARDPDTSPYALNVVAADMDAAEALRPRLASLAGVAGVRWLKDFIPNQQEEKLAALRVAKDRLGDSFFVEDKIETPNDAELAEAFAAMKASAEAIAGTPEENPIDRAIPAAGRELVNSLAEFEKQLGIEPGALRELGEALAAQMIRIAQDLRAKFSVAEPVTIEDVPPDLRSEWVSADGQVRLRVLPATDIGTAAAMQEFTESVQAVAPNAAGAPASIVGAGKAILSAFAEAILYTVVSIGIVVSVLRRRVTDVLLVLAPLAVAALWTVAASVGFNLPFNFANIIVIPMLIGLGVASSIHIVVRSHEMVKDSTGSHEEGMHVLDTSTPLAVLVAELNTVAAFATLAVAEHRGLFSMGVLLGLAILFVLIVSLILLPSFMIALGFRETSR